MQVNENSLTFINHASVLIKGRYKSILTDPWFEGDAFHKGWRLLYENKKEDIDNILDETSYIWLSHEHPDHFSILFFKKYGNKILERNISILFQKSEDKRIVNYLRGAGFNVMELSDTDTFEIEQDFRIKIIRDEFYDSALLVTINGKTLFNLNDCPIRSKERIEDFKRKHGTCDILLTQFSYAAWKGGRENKAWRTEAAMDKVTSLVDQGNILQAKVVVPFASFVWFSNELNGYLNDAVNTPHRVFDFCARNHSNFQCVILKPFETIDIGMVPQQNASSIEFWEEKYKDLPNRPCDRYDQSFSLEALRQPFEGYCRRLKSKNSWWLVRLLGKFGVLGAFSPVSIRLIDTNEVILVDLPNEVLRKTDSSPDIAMHSESLAFIFNNPFGFDTLTVNGNFEEMKHGGFSRCAKNFALENLNNLGYSLAPSLVFNFKLIRIFMSRLIKVAKKLG